MRSARQNIWGCCGVEEFRRVADTVDSAASGILSDEEISKSLRNPRTKRLEARGVKSKTVYKWVFVEGTNGGYVIGERPGKRF